jgi:predicted enzyme related to lactoylglutathione lyase
MAMDGAAAPILSVRSIERTAAFYGLQLGCSIIYPGKKSDLSLIAIWRGGHQLRFRAGGRGILAASPPLLAKVQWDASFLVPDVDALATDFIAHGVLLTEPLADGPGGVRGFEIADPDGHILSFVKYGRRQSASRIVRVASPGTGLLPSH